MDKVIQIANLEVDKGFANPQRGRVYSAKGISPCIDNMGGNREPKFLWIKPKMKFIYKIPHGYFPGGACLKYAPTVSSSAWSANNLLVWITPKDISSGSHTTQGATSPTTTLSHCGRALLLDAPETD